MSAGGLRLWSLLTSRGGAGSSSGVLSNAGLSSSDSVARSSIEFGARSMLASEGSKISAGAIAGIAVGTHHPRRLLPTPAEKEGKISCRFKQACLRSRWLVFKASRTSG
ncbi:hypothetical protein BDU57DRAFT_511461 [Ampelomyces quisqualis]|uniref:Uncharacterized protein n=1 Tax=Ampelomyces quisqualis TaxID=50730 RepID=A0A6A5QTH7_AMPQU|nr:hypothetical protein BDU57DRAFT_511461 [Ampelomyces quisqualis]